MQNIELKVGVNSFASIKKALQKNGADFKQRLNQIDCYYSASVGRVKIREINNKIFQLIYYIRPNKRNGKISNYEIMKIKNKEDKNKLSKILADSIGKKVIVNKNRDLWILRNTRIHLDRVQGLGNFLELETVVKKKGKITEYKNEFEQVCKFLQLEKYKKFSKSYSDMIASKR